MRRKCKRILVLSEIISSLGSNDEFELHNLHLGTVWPAKDSKLLKPTLEKKISINFLC